MSERPCFWCLGWPAKYLPSWLHYQVFRVHVWWLWRDWRRQ